MPPGRRPSNVPAPSSPARARAANEVGAPSRPAPRRPTPAPAPAPTPSSPRLGGSGGRGAPPPAAAPAPIVEEATPATQVPTTPDEQEAYIRTRYGFMSWALDDPEIGPMLRQAASEGWDEARLRGALQSTTWWRTTSSTARDWQQLEQTDPATAAQRLSARRTEVTALAEKVGLSLTPQRLEELSLSSIRFGWNEDVLRQNLALEMRYSPDAPPLTGEVSEHMTDVKAIANKYFSPLSDDSAFEFGRRILAGTLTIDGVESMFRQQAKGRFSSISSLIDQGIAPAEYFEPYRQSIAAELEISPSAVDFVGDPRFGQIVEYAVEGQPVRPMTLSEARTYVRSLPEWEKTSGARRDAAAFTEQLTRLFGEVA